MQRMGMIIGIRPEKIQDYKDLHAAVWPGVLAKISECNIRNYSIFLREPECLLFAYFEYHGEDFAADLGKMAADPLTQKWWDVSGPCQRRLDSAKDGEFWSSMSPVFFCP